MITYVRDSSPSLRSRVRMTIKMHMRVHANRKSASYKRRFFISKKNILHRHLSSSHSPFHAIFTASFVGYYHKNRGKPNKNINDARNKCLHPSEKRSDFPPRKGIETPIQTPNDKKKNSNFMKPFHMVNMLKYKTGYKNIFR